MLVVVYVSSWLSLVNANVAHHGGLWRLMRMEFLQTTLLLLMECHKMLLLVYLLWTSQLKARSLLSILVVMWLRMVLRWLTLVLLVEKVVKMLIDGVRFGMVEGHNGLA